MNKLPIGSNYSRLGPQQFVSIPDNLEPLLNNIPGMSYRSLPRFPWRMHFVSAGSKAVCGYEASCMQEGRLSWGHIIHPDDLDYVQKAVGDAVDNHHSFEMEYRIEARSGAEKWVWDRGYPLPGTGDKNDLLEGFITDITDRKRAEISLIREQAYSRAVIETAIEAVITVSEKGRIATINTAAQTIFGYRPDEIEGVDFRVLLSAQYQDAYMPYLTPGLKRNASKLVCRSEELIARKKDGSGFPIQLSVSEVQHQAQRLFVCLIRDISVQRRAENEAREHRDKLARVDRLNSLGEMASGIAHEINQPLTAISLFSQVGKRFMESQQYDRLPEIFDKLTVHAKRAGAILEQMQNMTRQHDSVREPMDCNVAVSEIASLAEAESRIHDIPIEIQLGDRLPAVIADKIQIQQVVLNLLRNGMESMAAARRPSGEAIKLTTRLNENGDAQITVIDSGRGVADEVAEQVFKPFLTTKQTGMGLGLSISRAIVRAHGGQLSFDNNAAGGATFFFTLPAVR